MLMQNAIRPLECIETIIKGFSQAEKKAFLGAFFVGIFTHLIMIVNNYPNGDGNIYGVVYSNYQWDISLGRWLFPWLTAYRNEFLLVSIISVVAIVFIAFSAMIIVHLLEINNPINAFLTGVIMVTFPVVACYFSIAFCADFYAGGALFLSVVSIYFINKEIHKKIYFFAGILCIVVSLAIYQSYISVCVALCVFLLIRDIIKGTNISEFFLKAIRFLSAGVLGSATYIVLTKVIQTALHIPLASYRGLSSINVELLKKIPGNAINAYKSFFNFYFSDAILYNSNLRKVIYGALFFLAIASVCKLCSKRKIYRQKVLCFSLWIIIALLPMAVCFIGLLASDTEINSFMLPGMFLPLVFALSLCEEADVFGGLGQWTYMGACTLLMCSYIIFANAGYLNMQLMWERSYSIANRVLDRVEQTPGYVAMETPVLVYGSIPSKSYPQLNPKLNMFLQGTSSMGNQIIPHPYSAMSWGRFFYNYLGASFVDLPQEKHDAIIQSLEAQNMPIFPDVNSVKMIDGVIFVKLS